MGINDFVQRDVGASAEMAPFGRIEWAVRAGKPDGVEQTLGLAVFEAGGSNAAHYHPNCEEIVYVLEGEIQHTLGDEVTTLWAGDVIVVPRNMHHRIINDGSKACRLLVMFSSPEREFVEVE
jgi:quercetin dioxygenase-like cupin family protein